MIVFVSNFINHHQFPIAKEFVRQTVGNFRFIETEEMPTSFKRTGYPIFDEPWIIRSWANSDSYEEAKSLIEESEIVITSGNLFIKSIYKRLSQGKLTFEYGERWFKKGYINLLSPRLILSQLFYHLYGWNKPYFRLNSSAFAANDLHILRSFKNKMFKWGYFTEPHNVCHKWTASNESCRIMFVARFIDWKHPEIPIIAAKKLKDRGYRFVINMFGSGILFDRMKNLISELGVSDIVVLKGTLPNEEIISEMSCHDIFVFTSDQNEGWGAVLNEAMSCGCAVLASDKIGAVPFLVSDNINGCIFSNENVQDFTNKLEYLIQHPTKRQEMGVLAQETINTVWSPKNAVSSFIKLSSGLLSNESVILREGPCSVCHPI